MPLKPEQEKIIRETVDYFFDDLPTEKNQLHEAIEDFKKAAANELPATHDLFFLQKCFYDPCVNLRTLDLYSALTIGDAQLYLLHYMREKLQEAVHAVNGQWQEPEWDDLQRKIEVGDQFAQPFFSRAVEFKGEDEAHPYEVPAKGRMYAAHLVPQPDLRVVRLEVNVQLERPVRKTTWLANYPHDYRLDFEEEKIIAFERQLMSDNEGKSSAEKKAEEVTIPIVMRELREQGIIAIKDNEASSSAKKLMTWEFYFHQVNNLVWPFDLIKNINVVQYNTLISSTIIDRLKNGEYTLDGVLAFSVAERNLVINPFYYSGIRSGQFDFVRDFKGLSEEETKNLNCPQVMNLLKAGKISVTQARGLPGNIGKLFLQPWFCDLIFKANPDRLAFLLSPLMTNLFCRDIESLTQHAMQLLLNNYYVQFFVSMDVLKISELKLISQVGYMVLVPSALPEEFNAETVKKIRKLMKNFLFYASETLLNEADLKVLYDSLSELFTPDKMAAASPKNSEMISLTEDSMDVFCRALVKISVQNRLTGLLEEKPQTLVDGRKDSLTILMKSCRNFNIDFAKILDLEIEKNFDLSLIGTPNAMVIISKHQEALGLNPLHLFELKFAQRILNHYENKAYCIDGETDGLAKITKDILSAAAKQLIRPEVMQSAIMRRILQRMAKNIKERFKDGLEMPAIYQIVQTVVLETEAKVESMSQIEALKYWHESFKVVAGNAEQCLTTYQGASFDAGRETKRQCLSKMFQQAASQGKMEEIKNFCEWMDKLNQGLNERPRVENMPRVSPAR